MVLDIVLETIQHQNPVTRWSLAGQSLFTRWSLVGHSLVTRWTIKWFCKMVLEIWPKIVQHHDRAFLDMCHSDPRVMMTVAFVLVVVHFRSVHFIVMLPFFVRLV